MSKRDQIRMETIRKRNEEIAKLQKEIKFMQERIAELEEDNRITMARMGTN